MVDMSLEDIIGGAPGMPDEKFEYKASLGGDTGRGELPNIPATQVEQDYTKMMQPATQVFNQDELGNYASKMLGLPSGAPPIHQLSLLAGRAGDETLNSDQARQVGASLLRRQMNGSKDKGWMREPLLTEYINSIGLNAGRPDSWDAELKRLYGI